MKTKLIDNYWIAWLVLIKCLNESHHMLLNVTTTCTTSWLLARKLFEKEQRDDEFISDCACACKIQYKVKGITDDCECLGG